MTEGPHIPKPVGIWLRVSTEDQARGDSPEHHEKRARMYAEVRGLKAVEVYHLERRAREARQVLGRRGSLRLPAEGQ